MAARIVKAQGHSLNVAGRAVGFEFVEIGASVPDFSGEVVRFEIYPLVRSRQRTQTPTQMHLPGTEEYVPIVLAVSLRLWRVCCCLRCRYRRAPKKCLQDDSSNPCSASLHKFSLR